MNHTQFTYTTNLPEMPVSADHIVESDKKPLRLEAGKSYLNRRGDFVGPLEYSNPIVYGKGRPFTDKDGRIYSREGFAGMIITDECPFDLVSEHIAPQSDKPKRQTHYSDQPGVKIELGDWVSLRGRSYEPSEIVEIEWGNSRAKVVPDFKEGTGAGWWSIGLLDFKTRGLAPQSEDHIVASSEKVSFPAVGARLRFTKAGFAGTGSKIGDEVEVKDVIDRLFATTTVRDSRTRWTFDRNWRDGLEVVPDLQSKTVTETFGVPLGKDGPKLEPLPTPPVRPKFLAEVPKGAIYLGSGPISCAPKYRWSGSSDGIWLTGATGKRYGTFYADEIGGPAHRAQPWFHESQLVAGEGDWSKITDENGDEITADQMRNKVEALSAYPPDESEWPEKPDAGEGMRWERQEKVGECEGGSKYIMLSRAGLGYYWKEKGPKFAIPQTWSGTVVFRAVPAPQWRELGPDEVIQEGDEVMNIREWHPAKASIGKKPEDGQGARTRRPLPPSDAVDPVSGVTVPGKNKLIESAINRAKSGKCEGNCDNTHLKGHSGECKAVRVIAKDGHNWGTFSYCETAIEEDRSRGFTIAELVDEAQPAERKAREKHPMWDKAYLAALTGIISNPNSGQDGDWEGTLAEAYAKAAGIYADAACEVLDGIGGGE